MSISPERQKLLAKHRGKPAVDTPLPPATPWKPSGDPRIDEVLKRLAIVEKALENIATRQGRMTTEMREGFDTVLQSLSIV